ncbi:ATP-binding protein [Oligoflexus sp.]|uniref:ATP-binding protein n=1 Tax=Oligoflexus sp. TaxID=1971216 RepID=UPI002D7740F4|nr:ATP-binding protein [Oligoflexus sp.]
MGHLHTIKGEARTLGLDSLSQAVHSLEDSAKILVQRGEQGPFLQGRNSLLLLLEHYKKIVSSLNGSPTGVLRADDEPGLLERIQPHWRSIQKQLAQGGLRAARLELVDAVVQWPEDLLNDVSDVILHALTNSADHGFLIPKTLGAIVERPIFSIICEAERSQLRVLVRDNGVGLNLQKLQQLGEKRGFRPGPGQSYADVLFEEGVSTAGLINLTSGRGIGMVAIREVAKRRSGQARIRPVAEGHGAELELVMSMPL